MSAAALCWWHGKLIAVYPDRVIRKRWQDCGGRAYVSAIGGVSGAGECATIVQADAGIGCDDGAADRRCLALAAGE